MHLTVRYVCYILQTFHAFLPTHLLVNTKQAFHITLTLLEEFYYAEQYDVY